MSTNRILVTGGTGFVASYVIRGALARNFQVRTTVRSPARTPELRRTVGDDSIEVVTADLTEDAGWDAAAQGCRYILHIASPFPGIRPANENDLVLPARDGTLRVLRAARDAGVHRVVMTSSFGAVGYGQQPPDRPFTEQDWTDPDAPGIDPYIKSKTVAERAAWDFVEGTDGGVELVVLNPTGIFGPVLSSDHPPSVGIIQAMLSGRMPRVPDLWVSPVDVRDLADLQMAAMLTPEAAGHRYLAASGALLSLRDIAAILRRRLGADAAKVSIRAMPSTLVRILAPFVPQLRAMVGNLGVRRPVCTDAARETFGWTPRPAEDTVVDTGRSLVHSSRTGG
ncbi:MULTISPECIES: aldehyde reductase [unclassified Solwaraspora]|uniref:SDR family oxidoreductase n=1 Tax=unclassified Solwaraspora TaxID=2627926 RepID=UPI00248AD8E9|nr:MULTISPECIES: aldehyde reductase [unclassified Solwaraspora]WBB99122.1 aldehyde reductase [Solwaraspora sp. WMMA2059]WBC22325.1 aldehyde reductase [Solwaraspora sp. WMMA2080]WFE19852.1 aldehyde reductase [Solwaraspora sp. WMMD937]WJK35625.1 aldehyde reductase [Solwaraspora sp. WMMA2065]